MTYRIKIGYHGKQLRIFKSKAKFVLIAKGRRFGLTRGFMGYAFEYALSGTLPVLWVDTIYSNMYRYIQIYLYPLLKELPLQLWHWDKGTMRISINKSFIDFKSAERPANLEGFSYGLVILNEAGIILKNKNLWLESIAPMLLDYKSSRAFIGGTPKGKRYRNENHFFYDFYKKASLSKNKKRYEAFNFSTYDNPLIDLPSVKELESELPAYLRAQEIHGKFVDNISAELIKEKWWIYLPNRNTVLRNCRGRVYQSWDTAFKKNEENDFNVCATWGMLDNMFVLLEIYVARLEFPELKDRVVKFYKRYKPRAVLIEDKASGQSLLQELQRNTRIPIVPVTPKGDKISRVNSVTPLFASGRVGYTAFTERSKSENENFDDIMQYVMNQCADFPNAENDDVVDSITQFLNYIKKNDTGKTEIRHYKKR